jgi:hypothetical protein|tara:strand:- start:493 stop:810 length:318 start_codon:yes stop_codon:yes gene_type:complete
MSFRLVTALEVLKQFCQERGVELKHSELKSSLRNNVIILKSGKNKWGSIGICENDQIRCFRRDNKKYRWAKLEGFSDQEVYDKLGEELLTEVGIDEMANFLCEIN